METIKLTLLLEVVYPLLLATLVYAFICGVKILLKTWQR